MTKTKVELKKEITDMIDKEYDTVCEWTDHDLEMLDYYYAMFGKNCAVNSVSRSISFSKGGYLTDVSVESWEIVSIVNEKTSEVVL